MLTQQMHPNFGRMGKSTCDPFSFYTQKAFFFSKAFKLDWELYGLIKKIIAFKNVICTCG